MVGAHSKTDGGDKRRPDQQKNNEKDKNKNDDKYIYTPKGSYPLKKTVKKGTLSPFGDPP